MGPFCEYIFEDGPLVTIENNGKSAFRVVKEFAWADQRAKVCFIFHKAQLRCQECFIEQETVLYETSKYSYA